MKPLPFLLALVVLAGSLVAGDAPGFQVITLKDKSVIRAQVTEMSGGFYIAKSPALGDMKIPSGEVVSIQQEAAAVSAPAQAGDSATAQPLPGAAGLDALKSAVASKVQGLVSTREGMNAVMEFSQNPDVKAVMNDPEVMKAIHGGDYGALMKSQAMKSLLDNPRTKALIQSIMAAQGGAQPNAQAGKPAAPAE